MILSILSDINLKGRRGRPSLNLLDMIRNDLKRKIILNSLRLISDFEDLGAIAIDRVEWKSLCSFYFDDIFIFIFETATNKVLRIAVIRYFEL